MNWETLNFLFMLNLQVCVVLLMCSIIHEFQFNVFVALKKWNFAMYSNPGIVAYAVEMLDLEKKLYAIQTCICLNGPVYSSVSLGNSSYCSEQKTFQDLT